MLVAEQSEAQENESGQNACLARQRKEEGTSLATTGQRENHMLALRQLLPHDCTRTRPWVRPWHKVKWCLGHGVQRGQQHKHHSHIGERRHGGQRIRDRAKEEVAVEVERDEIRESRERVGERADQTLPNENPAQKRWFQEDKIFMGGHPTKAMTVSIEGIRLDGRSRGRKSIETDLTP